MFDEINIKNNTDYINDEISFVESLHQMLLKEHGIILLEPMSKEKNKKIYNIVSSYTDIIPFNIGKGKDKQLVLRYKPKVEGYVDVKFLAHTGNLAYTEGNYDECIKNYLQILSFGHPRSYVYARLGLAFLKKHDKSKAIDYLTVADYISKHDTKESDFSKLILELKEELENNNLKPKQDNYYGIENIEEVTKHILNSNLDIKTVCKQFGMNVEQIDILILIYAREFYSNGDYTIGDYFYKLVEKSKNKTKNTSNLLEEVRKNKRFYINRATEKSKQLVLMFQSRNNLK